MNVNYIKCDICGEHIDKTDVFKKGGFRFKIKETLFSHFKKLDICDNCLNKIRIVIEDVHSEEELLNNILDSGHLKDYMDDREQSVYLQGVQDALTVLAPYKIRQQK